MLVEGQVPDRSHCFNLVNKRFKPAAY